MIVEAKVILRFNGILELDVAASTEINTKTLLASLISRLELYVRHKLAAAKTA